MDAKLTSAEADDFVRRSTDNIVTVSKLHLGTRFKVSEADEKRIKRMVYNQIIAERNMDIK